MERMRAMSNDQIIQHILSNRNNYYSILFVERQSSTDQIKVNYKKIAVRCHPDKNHENKQASEAFKLLNTAHSTLSDTTKRGVYDRNGVSGVQRHESGRPGAAGGARYAHYGAPPGDIFEELFGFRRQTARGPQRPRPGVHVEEVDIQPQILILIPVFLLLLLSIFMGSSSFFSEDDDGSDLSRGGRGVYGSSLRGSQSVAQQFSLAPDPERGYVVPRVTTLHQLNVKYYVSRKVEEILKHKRELLLAVEENVLKSQRNYLNSRCEAETYLYRSQRKKAIPKICEEYQEYRRKIG
ncbi:DnaJ like protein subfamily B member 12 [Angomonas deanei]|nr:DnaJ like protein subfamily B member 12 [Angomonas deanei]|eukprot:EPY33497.1 DnaJ like protein subfamily B member 12 [Angomonas deanei]